MDARFEEFVEKDATTREEEVAVRSTESPRQTPREDGNHDALYWQAEAHIRDSLHRVGTGKGPDIERGASLSERMVSSISQDNSLVLVATDRKRRFSISTHSVNVAVFSIRISQTLNCDLRTQREVALAALYHELGVVELSKDLVYRTKNPTREEMNRLRERPLYSARIFRNMGPEYYWLSRIVGQVYERENGMGYPRRLSGEELCEQARVIGIADVFDACIHKRPYREPLSGYQSLFELTTDQERSFSDRMVKALIRSFSLYPYNECVRISTGELGRVVDINSKNLSRPIVRVMSDPRGKALRQPRIVDLSEEPQLYISEALKGSKCL
jgi:HD-GYP domain-containing protein (c-di-GMP phosphodiesterase class II)